ncbi:MAG: MATE family efflux transporter [Ruminococcaceae bacterium]|nr:MATE family efflux transporter [Oscillospiraceae bacterium]
MNKTKTKDKAYMLSGSLWKGIILFAVPVSLTALLQQLFHSVDMMVVGSYCGPNELAAVGSNNAIINLLVNIFMGLSIGANVVIGHLIGEENPEKARNAMHTSIALSVISGITVAIIGCVFSRKLLELISSPPEVIDLATLYLRIYFAGIPFLMIYNFSAAILRSRGETTIPFLCLTTGGVLNICLNLIFVTVFNMGVAGVAVATSISNALSCFLVLRYLFNPKKEFHLDKNKIKVHTDLFKKILWQGIPLSIHSALYPFSNMFLQSGINSLGAITVAGNAAAISLEAYGMNFSDGFCQAALNFVSQNKGAKNYKRCIKSVLISMFYGIVFINTINLIIFLAKDILFGFFTTDPKVIAVGVERMKFMFMFYCFANMQGVITNTIRAMGYPIFSTATSIICICGFRVIWMNTVFKLYPSYKTILITYPLTWIMMFVIISVCTVFVFRREIKGAEN